MKKLSLKNIYKEFPKVIANNNITIDFNCSEVHAILGENGAGKTTLMNIIYGIYKPDRGDILIDDKKIDIKSPKDAIAHGIGMVHQHFMLIQNHTVCENIILGLNGIPFYNPAKKFSKKLKEISEQYLLPINSDAKIWQLSAGEQQRVEIIKALIRGAKFLILDEPTSVLTPQEVNSLFNTIKRLVKEGIGVIFISHKLDEVLAISDIITVLREGKVIQTLKPASTDKLKLAKLMIGREISIAQNKREKIKKRQILSVQNLWVRGDKGLYSVKDISFDLNEKEILGIAGVSGNGQKELVEVLVGLRKLEKGEIKILGKSIKNLNAKKISRLNVAHIPEERLKFGAVPDFTLYENVILKNYDLEPYCKKGLIDINKVKEKAKELVKSFNISTPSVETKIKLLSGGNIQKLICAREL
ncbi:MAG: ABC transporter ATP-binding protein, partial [Exilispira sp.]